MTAMFRINIDDKELQKKLQNVAASARDMKSVFSSIGEYMLQETENRFRDEKDPEGQKWQEHSPISLHLAYAMKGKKTHTKKNKETKSFSRYKEKRKILTDTGKLRNIIYQAKKDEVKIGSNLIYAALHQFGGKAGRNKKVEIPARPFLGINDENKEEIKSIIWGYFKDSLK